MIFKNLVNTVQPNANRLNMSPKIPRIIPIIENIAAKAGPAKS